MKLTFKRPEARQKQGAAATGDSLAPAKGLKIIVFSDSHGSAGGMVRAALREQPDLCFFLGDGERDLERLRESVPDLPVNAVRGNCDLRSQLPGALVSVAGGIRILAVHGHNHNVKYDPLLQQLLDTAKAKKADLVLFGHTHIPCLTETGGVRFLNPGSITLSDRPSYGIVTAGDGSFTAEIRYL